MERQRMAAGDLAKALGRIKAKMIVVAFGNDKFFPPADIEAEAKLIDGAEYRVIDSLFAHFAMFCLSDADKVAIDSVFSDLLAKN